MNRKLLLSIALLVFFAAAIQAQTVFSTRVAAASDDLEEYIPGANQTKTIGSVDNGSSDLELGSEAVANKDPQLVGIRFTNITVPQGAIITKAYLRFTVDNTSKNSDPSNLIIKAQAADNPETFNTSITFPISTRATLADSVLWNIRTGGWATTGESGTDQTTPDLKALVQTLVNRSGWASGNAMVFTIQGTGTKEAESVDEEPTKAPLLVIEYLPVTTVSKRVAKAEDDLEEYIPGANQTKTLGSMDAGSSDLELGSEAVNNKDPQLVGVRFSELNIPKGALITEAYIQFTTDNTSKNSDPSNLIIKAQAADNPPSFDSNVPFNISTRATLADSVAWNITPGSWATIGEAGVNQRTTNIARLVQTLVNRDGWASGNAMVFTIQGTGTKESESADEEPTKAPLLIVKYVPVARLSSRVAAAEDDLEEYIPGANQTKTLGSMDVGSSDLELGSEAVNNKDPQLVGVRFRNIQLPKGAIVQNAYIQFTVDNTSKNSDPSNLIIKAQAADNPPSFDGNVPFNITSRATLADSIAWAIPNGSWPTIGEAGVNQRTPNIARLVQTLANRDGWASGNAMVFTIQGTGTKESESADEEPAKAPVLVIDYLTAGDTAVVVKNPTTAYPIKRQDTWSYLDKGTSLDSVAWKTVAFLDTSWAYANGAFGYGLPNSLIKTNVAFGANAQNKYITTYFRKRFKVADLAALSNTLELNVLLDDGAVIYINGAPALTLNMPTSGVTSSTLATAEVKGNEELTYFTYDIPKTLLTTGDNIIAVEVHQSSASSSDLAFDLELRDRQATSNASNLGCTGVNDTHIGCFTSLIPRDQNDTLALPSNTHAFQYITAAGQAYKGTAGTFPSNFDFTGYVPINGSSSRGYLSINHEKEVGGVSISEIQLNNQTGLWEILNSGPVDFIPVVSTTENCSGTVTPWNTIITCEEAVNITDSNGDGYHDLGWATEIDPVTRQVRDFGNGKQKLWRLGKMDHENVVIAKDNKTLYEGEDQGQGSLYKFIADQPTRLNSGVLYALKLDSAYVNGEARGTTGRWIQIPNSTPAECNNVKAAAAAAGAQFFAGIEDVEISPIDGKIYFAVKGAGRVYRFKDNGTTISEFETFVGGKSYRVTTNNKVVTESWGGGNDNLTFDDRGNLWVMQDGGRNHLWIVRPDHTQASPKVEVFLQTPIAGEPTGLTFTPDFKYGFVSMQECDGQVAQQDISGKSETFNKSVALVFARNQFLGKTLTDTDEPKAPFAAQVTVFPNPFREQVTIEVANTDDALIQIELFDAIGKLVRTAAQQSPAGNFTRFTMGAEQAGFYFARVTVNGQSQTYKLLKQ